jgi:hypothetical protein
VSKRESDTTWQYACPTLGKFWKLAFVTSCELQLLSHDDLLSNLIHAFRGKRIYLKSNGRHNSQKSNASVAKAFCQVSAARLTRAPREPIHQMTAAAIHYCTGNVPDLDSNSSLLPNAPWMNALNEKLVQAHQKSVGLSNVLPIVPNILTSNDFQWLSRSIE